MILVLTPNPALDLTYTLEALHPGREHRAREVHVAPGGKGLNAARVLDQLGAAVTVLGPLGGPGGQDLEARLAADHPRIRRAFTQVSGHTRRTVTVLEGGRTTGINEPGPHLDAEDLAALRADVLRRLAPARARSGTATGGATLPSALAVCGSLPGGMAAADLADLVEAARGAGVPVLVDTSGPALLAAAAAGADLLTPNRAEVLEATGEATVPEACRHLIALGAGGVVCSLGPDGMLALLADGTGRRARPPRPLTGNPTGAGDAAVAALLRHLSRDGGRLTADALADAVATSASALACPTAGAIDLALRRRLRAEMTSPAAPSLMETR